MGTMVDNSQEYRLHNWATRSSVCSFARTAHLFACFRLLASLAPSAALTHSLARSLPSSWERGFFFSTLISHSFSPLQIASLFLCPIVRFRVKRDIVCPTLNFCIFFDPSSPNTTRFAHILDKTRGLPSWWMINTAYRKIPNKRPPPNKRPLLLLINYQLQRNKRKL